MPKDELIGEHIQQHRRTMRLARGAVITMALLLVVATIAAVLAVIRGNETLVAQHTAIARGMIGQAEAVRDSDPLAALRFSIAADSIDPSPLTRAGLADIVLASPYRTTLPASASVDAVTVVDDGRTMAVGSLDGTVQLWDLADADRPRPLGSPLRSEHGRVRVILFNAAGTLMITGHADGTASLWDMTGTSATRTRPGRSGRP